MRGLTEARRVVRPGGIVAVAAINRFASLFDGLSAEIADPSRRSARSSSATCATAAPQPGDRPHWFTTAFFHHPEELRAEVEDAGLAVVELVGVEGSPVGFRSSVEQWETRRRAEAILFAARATEIRAVAARPQRSPHRGRVRRGRLGTMSTQRFPTPRYVQPGWFTCHVFNPMIAMLTRAGISVWGSRELRVRGRKSGEWRAVPGQPADARGPALPRRTARATPNGCGTCVSRTTGELRVGKRIEAFRATEIADADKPPILRAYLKRWKAEVGVFFDGVSAKSSEDELRRIAPDHPYS